MPTLKVPTVAAILTRPDSQVLLLQRDDRPGLEFPGWWTLPGGKVEDGETPDEAIRRELWEEIELEVPLSLWQVYERAHRQKIAGQTVLIVQHVYTGQTDRRADSLALNEGQALAFVGPGDLPNYAITYGFEALLAAFFQSARKDMKEAP